MPSWSALEAHLRQEALRQHIPGLAVAVAVDGRLVFGACIGVADAKTGAPIDNNTIFAIGSLTKSFTVVSLLQMESEGSLSLEDPVVRYISEFRPSVKGPVERVLIRHLLSHTAGIPPLAGLGHAVARSAALSSRASRKDGPEIVDFASHTRYLSEETYTPIGAPGEVFSYSNDSFVVAAYIVERVAGRSFYDEITRRVLEPLQMTRSVWSPHELEALGNAISPHLVAKDGTVTRDAWPDIGPYAASGELKSSPQDMLAYGSALLRTPGVLPPSGFQRMATPAYNIGGGRFYGLGMEIAPYYGGGPLVGHGGAMPCFAAHMLVAPRSRAVVVVMANTYAPVAELALSTMNALLDLPEGTVWDGRTLPPVPSPQAGRLAGTYRSGEGHFFQFHETGGLLYVSEGKAPEPVRFLEDGSVKFVDRRGNARTGRFLLDDRGEAWAIFTGLRVVPRADPARPSSRNASPRTGQAHP